MGLARNIDALLVKFDITPGGFAEMVGVSAPTVSRWRSGGMNIRNSTVERICDAFDLSRDDLLSDKDGLAAQVFGYTEHTVATIPLLTGDALLDWEIALRNHDVCFVDVPSFVTEHHPRAFAAVVCDDALAQVVPVGAHVVVDPELEPCGEAIAAVAGAGAPAGDGGLVGDGESAGAGARDGFAGGGQGAGTGALAGVTLRRVIKGRQARVLTCDRPDVYADMVVAGGVDAGGRPVRILGTVVWFQAAGMLA